MKVTHDYCNTIVICLPKFLSDTIATLPYKQLQMSWYCIDPSTRAPGLDIQRWYSSLQLIWFPSSPTMPPHLLSLFVGDTKYWISWIVSSKPWSPQYRVSLMAITSYLFVLSFFYLIMNDSFMRMETVHICLDNFRHLNIFLYYALFGFWGLFELHITHERRKLHALITNGVIIEQSEIDS